MGKQRNLVMSFMERIQSEWSELSAREIAKKIFDETGIVISSQAILTAFKDNGIKRTTAQKTYLDNTKKRMQYIHKSVYRNHIKTYKEC